MDAQIQTLEQQIKEAAINEFRALATAKLERVFAELDTRFDGRVTVMGGMEEWVRLAVQALTADSRTALEQRAIDRAVAILTAAVGKTKGVPKYRLDDEEDA